MRVHLSALRLRPRFATVAVAIALSLALVLSFVVGTRGVTHAAAASSSSYEQTNLVSDIAGVARFTDPNLVNSWGLARSSTSPWWVADNGTGVSTLYDARGHRFPIGNPLVVTIPPPKGSPAGTTSAPTGTVFNGTGQFVVSSGGNSGTALFIFDTEDGTISGWNPNVNPTKAVRVVDNSASGAVYKGLALASNGSGNFLYATNFHAGAIDVFDSNFAPAHLSGSFTDPNLPAGYAPFDIVPVGNDLFVSYAKQDAAKHDDVAGPGHGFVDVFDTNGNFIKRLISHGLLNSPWGMTIASPHFGQFSNDLLVGNFGNGRINVYDPNTGASLGTLRNGGGRAITINGLWALAFGNGATAGPLNTLFFTAGIADESHGLFGSIATN